MQKSIYSVGKKQKNPYKNNIEKHSEKIKNSNYVFLLLENYLKNEKRKNRHSGKVCFFDIERSIEKS